MKLETKPIEEVVNGEHKFAGLSVAVIHNGKVVIIKAPTDFGTPQNIVVIVKYLNRMITALAQSCPELLDAPIGVSPKKVRKKKNESVQSTSS